METNTTPKSSDKGISLSGVPSNESFAAAPNAGVSAMQVLETTRETPAENNVSPSAEKSPSLPENTKQELQEDSGKHTGGDEKAPEDEPAEIQPNNIQAEPNDAEPEEPAIADVNLGVQASDVSEYYQQELVNLSQDTPQTTANLEATATVKCLLLPNSQVATLAFRLRSTLSELKHHFSTELRIPMELILLMFNGKVLDDSYTLADLGVGPNGTVQLEMQSADPVNTPIPSFRLREEYHMPDVISVRVNLEGTSEYKDIVVEIERKFKRKPYLGGYRHKHTLKEYHHASAQTIPKPVPESGIAKTCRDTQTVNLANKPQQVYEDTSTQMTGIGVYTSNMGDKLIQPKYYQTAEELADIKLKKIIILQKYWRRWLAKQLVQKLREDKDKRIEWERLQEAKKRREKEQRLRKEWERRINPRKKEDFDLLYSFLEKWRAEEEVRINETMTGAERKAALCQLLDEETQLIAAIHKHKIDATVENKKQFIEDFLSKVCAPKRWRGPDGAVTEMDTPYTIRARELKNIYNSLNMKYLTQDERLDVLLTLKHTVKEHDCKLTREIIDLIDREADLLMRGVREANLEGLRKRISTLFLQYIKTPIFNPEIARSLKVPQDPTVLRQNIYYCNSCCSYKSSTEFEFSSKSRTAGTCRACRSLDNEGHRRQDFSYYKNMLQELRQTEEAYRDGSKIAFLLQEDDLRYLVEKIWGSSSMLCGWSDLYELQLIRWDKFQEWSPWNCFLLTHEEATAHEKLEDMAEAYGDSFIHKVKVRHVLAKNYFSKLPSLSNLMYERSLSAQNINAPAIHGKSVRVQVGRIGQNI